MKKVYIRNKLISLGGSSQVLDENHQPLYKVKGKIFSFTKKKLIYDKNDNLLFIVRNKYWKVFVHKAYILDANKNKIATVKEKRWSSNRYLVEDYTDEIKIDGRFFSVNSTILKNGEDAGYIQRGLLHLTDFYSLEADEKDIPFFVALVIAFDNIRDKKLKDK